MVGQVQTVKVGIMIKSARFLSLPIRAVIMATATLPTPQARGEPATAAVHPWAISCSAPVNRISTIEAHTSLEAYATIAISGDSR